MIFIDMMKNLKIYKTSAFLPTLEKDKKRKSAILLMSPNYNSSKKLIQNPLFINKLRYSSYYLDKDISYYINSKNAKIVDDSDMLESFNPEPGYINSILEISTEERNKLDDSDFGLPEDRKFPLDNAKRVKSAIKFFNYCPKEKEKELADNIIKAIEKYNIKISIGDNNRF